MPPTASKPIPPASTPIRLPCYESSPESIIKFISEIAAKIPTTLDCGKSVTSIAKKRAIDLAESITKACKLLSSRLPDADATICEPNSGVIIATLKEEFAKLRDDLHRYPTPTTYASAAAAQPRLPSVKTPVSRPAIIVQSGVPEIRSAKEVTDAWRKGVSFRDASFAPAKVQRVSNNKIRVEFDSDSQRQEALKKLESVKELKAEPAHRSRPLVIIKGVSKHVDSGDIIPLLIQQNPGVSSAAKDGDLRLRFLRNNRNDSLFNAVLEVSPTIRLLLLDQQRVNIDHQRVRVAEYSPFLQCFKCLQFGHTQSKCVSESRNCSHCASDSHGFDTCPSKTITDSLRCYNCDSDNKKFNRKTPTAHSATSTKHCPKIKSMVQRLAARTEY